MSFIGVDLGTTCCKCVIFGAEGNILAERCFEYALLISPGRIEQDAEEWWSLVKRVIAECVAACLCPQDIEALSVSSQGISFVPVGEDGHPLANAISWLDGRAVAQTEWLRERFGSGELFRRTGKRPSPCYMLPKLMWLKSELPEIYSGTWKFLMGLDYIMLKLTGRAATDHSMASGTMAYDITRMVWDEELIEACGLDGARLPEIGFAGSDVGLVREDIAAELGLPLGVRVALGAQDQKCAAIGAGIGRGIATVSLGTATAVSSLCSRPVLDERMRVPCFSLDGSRWILESVIGTSGASLKWLRDTLFEGMTYAEITECASRSGPGSNSLAFCPHLQGAVSPYWVDGAAGTLHGITLSSTRSDIARSVLEGVAYQIAVNVSLHEEITGNGIGELRLFGGGARSDLWCGIIADVTGLPVTVPRTTEAAAMGAAMLAGMETARKAVPMKRYEPRPEIHGRYRNLMQNYLKVQDAILNQFEQQDGAVWED